MNGTKLTGIFVTITEELRLIQHETPLWNYYQTNARNIVSIIGLLSRKIIVIDKKNNY